jgi:hypothetical protein
MTGAVTFNSEDIGVRFKLDARFEQSPPLPDPPGFHVPSAHFTLSAGGEWLASFHVVAAESPQPVTSDADLQDAVDAFLAMQRTWDASRVDIIEPCHGIRLAGLPAWRTVHIMQPAPVEDGDDAAVLEQPVFSRQHAVFDGSRRIHLDLVVLPPERYELEREALDLPFRTLEVERRAS